MTTIKDVGPSGGRAQCTRALGLWLGTFGGKVRCVPPPRVSAPRGPTGWPRCLRARICEPMTAIGVVANDKARPRKRLTGEA